MLKELVKLANHLDSIGHKDISNDLDSIIRKMAQEERPGLYGEAGEPAAEAMQAAGGRGGEADSLLSGFSGAGESIKRRLHKMKNAQLYHPEGMRGVQEKGRVFTNAVEFNWGKYEGIYSAEPYYIYQGRTELGDIQMKGDPFTYEEAGDKLRVISGPESVAYSIGRLTDDTRATPSSTAPSSEPEGGESAAAAMGATPADQSKSAKEALERKLKGEVEAAYLELATELNDGERKSPTTITGNASSVEKSQIKAMLESVLPPADRGDYTKLLNDRGFLLTYIPSATELFSNFIDTLNNYEAAKKNNFREEDRAFDGAVLASDTRSVIDAMAKELDNLFKY